MSVSEVGPKEGKLTIHFFVEAQNYRGNQEIFVEYCLRIMGNGNQMFNGSTVVLHSRFNAQIR